MSARCPRCGSALPADRLAACPVCLLTAELPAIELGAELELVEEIGRGGMGAVYRARDRELGREVAVKVLSEELARRADFRARFEREARALARLSHPNVVTIHGIGRDDGQSWIVMELVPGGTLAERIPLARDAALAIADQVCAALAYAHQRGVVHRDVKPHNVLLDAEGRVRLSDFGLAGLLEREDAERLTRPGIAMGTPAYTAPEALSGAPPDPRMDVYSVGVLLYQMLTGRLPLGAFEPLDPDLDDVVRRALAPDPGRRQADAGELRAELARCAGHDAAEGVRRLPDEEVLWMRAMALVASFATATLLWAVYVSLVPRVLAPGEEEPLIMISRRLADGRTVAYARFETWPTLVALLTIAGAAALFGMLRRHWKAHRLLEHRPDAPLRSSQAVLAMGTVALAVYVLRKLLEHDDASAMVGYVPLIGAAIEIAVLYFAWRTILEAWRVARPLWREPRLWAGLFAAALPPVHELWSFLRGWAA